MMGGINISKILILYFSGTGNTAFIADKIREKLNNINVMVKCSSVESFNPQNVRDFTMLVFGFPVYGFDMPKFLKDYANKLTMPQNRGVIIYSTMGYKSGNAMRKSTKLFVKNDFFPIDNYEFVMPGNDSLIIKNKDSKKVQEVREKNFNKSEDINKKVKIIVEKIIDFKDKNIQKKDVNIPKLKILPFLFGYPLQLIFKIFEKIFIKKFRTDDSCTGCGICEEICPANNIVVKNNDVIFGDECYLCLRCINQCPEEAVQIGKFTENKFRFKGPMGGFKP